LLGPSATAIAAYNGPKVWQQISVGGSYNPCVIASNNQAYCWGSNGWGELGNNSTTPSLVPVAVDTSGVLSGKTILSISTSADHSCAIASDNLAYCWGYNQSGQLGNNSTTQSLVPVAVYTGGVLSGKTVKSIVPQSVDHTCAIASDNLAYCWGSNSNGQLGNNSTTQSSVPVAVDTSGVLSGKTINTIITGNAYTCAIASDNLAYCWGYNNFGQLGNNSTTQSLVPVAVNTSGVLSGKTVMSITSTSASVCAIASDNLAYCWGNDNYGQLGNNSTTQSQVPVAVNTSGVLSGKTIVSITTGNLHTCAIASDYQAYCWGYNVHGALGNNSTTDSHVPVAVNTSGVLSGKTIRSIAGGIYHTCAIASDYHAYCWGWNINGELGNNSNTESDVPVAVNPLP
jgi:alpha-tubulin suppressor-like RCC1 family protein